MDPLSVIAGVVGIVAVALQSTKVIYGAVSRYGEADDKVTSLASAIQTLTQILKNLQLWLEKRQMLQVIQRKRSSQGVQLLPSGLEECIQACAADLARMERFLRKLQSKPSARQFQTSLKRVKATFKGDAVQEKLDLVQRHITALSFYLSSVSSDESTDRLTQTNKMLGEIASAQSSHAQTATLLYANSAAQASTLSYVDAGVRSLRIQNDGMRETLGDHGGILSNVQAVLQQLSIGANERSHVHVSEIQRLADVISNLTIAVNSAPRASTSDRAADEALDNKIFRTLVRLSTLGKLDSSSDISSQTEKGLEELRTLIEILESRAGQRFDVIMGRHHGADDTENDSSFDGFGAEERRDVNLIKGQMAVALKMMVNTPASQVQLVQRRGSIELKRRQIRRMLRHGELSLLTSKRRQIPSGRAIMEEKKEYLLDFRAVLDFLSRDPDVPRRFVAYFSQNFIGSDCRVSLPSFWSYNLRDPGDGVFQLILMGDLAGLQAEIRSGRASPRDCDAEGRSLLHYATSARKPSICTYLLQEGADIDLLAPLLGKDDDVGNDFEIGGNTSTSQISLLDQLEYSLHNSDYVRKWVDSDLHMNNYETVMDILLENGADPLLQVSPSSNRGLFSNSSGRTDLSVKLAKKLRNCKFGMNERNEQGETILHEYMGSHEWASVRPFVQAGSNVMARDNSGNTPLHLLFRFHARKYSSEIDSVFFPTIELIRAGADPYATNNAGITVEDEIAQASLSSSVPSTALWDGWTSALGICGIQPNQNLIREHRFDETYSPMSYLLKHEGQLFGCEPTNELDEAYSSKMNILWQAIWRRVKDRLSHMEADQITISVIGFTITFFEQSQEQRQRQVPAWTCRAPRTINEAEARYFIRTLRDEHRRSKPTIHGSWYSTKGHAIQDELVDSVDEQLAKFGGYHGPDNRRPLWPDVKYGILDKQKRVRFEGMEDTHEEEDAWSTTDESEDGGDGLD